VLNSSNALTFELSVEDCEECCEDKRLQEEIPNRDAKRSKHVCVFVFVFNRRHVDLKVN
jgi:hypothetical protein